jgi:uncharacterized protein YhaN
MRLRRLDLVRYGHFTDFVLDLGEKPANTSDFHIVYGPNEAGKSTAFDGYLDFLFGIPARSGYNFLHDYNSMRLGACLEVETGPLELIRIKKMRNDLLDAQENPANGALLSKAIGGLNRDEYRAMFSLDDVTIEAGGNDILASRGNLGELLFSAASGLSELGTILTEAKAEADLFHKKSAKKTQLAEARRELKSLAQALKEIDMDAGRYKSLLKAQKQAQERHDQAKSACDQLRMDKERLAGLLACLPEWHQRSKVLRQLSGLPDVAGFDAEWLTQAQDLQARAAALSAHKEAAKNALVALSAQKDALQTDVGMIAAQLSLESLLAAPYARAQTAVQDLPRRAQEKQALQQDYTRLLGQAGLAQAQAENLSQAGLETLARLARDWMDAQGKMTAAQQELCTAQQALAQLGEATGFVDESRSDTPLHVLLDHLEPENLVSQWQRVCSEETEKEQSLQAGLRQLLPWQGQGGHLPQNLPGEAQAVRLGRDLAQAAQAVTAAETKLSQTQAEHSRLTARIAALRDQDRVKDTEELPAKMQQRDGLWQRHLQHMTPASAAAFSDAMAVVDQLQDARLQMAEKVALLREWQLDLVGVEVDLEKDHLVVLSRQKQFENIKTQVKDVLQGVGLPKDFAIEDLPAWLKTCGQIQETKAALSALQQKKSRLAEQMDAARDALSEAFAAPQKADLRLVTRLAREKVTEFAQQKEAQKALILAQKHVAQRLENCRACEAAFAKIQALWSAQAKAQSLEFDPARFGDAENTLRALLQKQQELDQLSARIAAMQLDADQFEREIKALAKSLAVETDAPALEIARQLQTRLRAAQEALSHEKRLESQLAEQKRVLEQVQKEQLEQESQVQVLRQLLGQEGEIAALVLVATQAQKAAALQRELDRIERQVFLRLGVQTVAAVDDLLDGCDMATLKAQLAAVETDLAAQVEHHARTIGDLRSATDALAAVGGDEAAAALQEKRQTILLDLEEKAKHSLRLRLGALVAHEALIQYRDSHRSGMLAQTEQAFVALTNGRYKALQTQSDGENETLLAIQAADNRGKLAQDMSKGTRFQLYLALRVAGYKQFAQSGVTLPFVADDIFETFDDTRTAAALGLLAELGKTGQALYFTHHKHVVDLARQGLGDNCQIHELPVR